MCVLKVTQNRPRGWSSTPYWVLPVDPKKQELFTTDMVTCNQTLDQPLSRQFSQLHPWPNRMSPMWACDQTEQQIIRYLNQYCSLG